MDINQQQQLEVYPHQVSGKEPKLISPQKTLILKGYNLNEYTFYQRVNSINSHPSLQALKAFLPIFHGKHHLSHTPSLFIASEHQNQWLKHLASRYSIRNQANSFIILQNLSHGYQVPCIFDIKIGGRNVEGKQHKITKSVQNYCIKLNGCKMQLYQQSVLLTKYFLGSTDSFNTIIEYFAVFYSYKHQIQEHLVSKVLNQLQSLISVFQQVRGYRFISSSLYLLYDQADLERYAVKVIDFGRIIEESGDFIDNQSIKGLKNIRQILITILKDKTEINKKLSLLTSQCLKAQGMHIPQHKKTKSTNE